MFEILILTSELSERKTPNAICVSNVISKLKEKQKCNVTYIVPQRKKEQSFENLSGDRVFRYRRWWCEDLIEEIQQANSVRFKSIKLRLLFVLWHIKLFIGFRNYPQYSKKKELNAKRLVLKLLNEKQYDLFICTYNPIESVSCAELVKKNSPLTKVIVYSLDSLSNRGNGRFISNKRGMEKGYKWEERLFSASDILLIPESHYDHYVGKRFDAFISKILKVDYPLLEIKENHSNSDVCNEKAILVYAGSLDLRLRNPELMLRIISSIQNVVLELYTNGNCDGLINSYAKGSNAEIKLNGYIDRLELLKKERNADFLISIGNNSTQMVPSKLFELFATGKPILHFKNSDYDSCESYLNRYKNCIIIDHNTTVEDVMEFLDKNIGLTVDFERIKSEFKLNMPEYTADILCKVLNEN